ncbi:MAG: small nuclear ribonucleoprotein (Sm) [Candidatus Methanomethylicota archaeon]|uniref:Small nuclear ribonucleoprotein (Sm) n=1 Tax=Thermoproteota archaeon TaxID=2056631 RepID=A0A497EQY3_9CREN|nr:MAG: small nuclear ribonucleoprotein (Sm) [Candidatus Verstraetearchaeota archaeon]
MSLAGKRFVGELNSFLDRNIEVITVQGRKFSGKLIGFDPSNLNLCLADAKGDDGESFIRLIIRGDVVAEIALKEAPFDLRGLAERLERVFPNMVKIYEDAGVIMVMDRIRVTPQGVEGTGPMVDRVKRVFEQFLLEKSAEKVG